MTYRDRRLCDMVVRIDSFGAAYGPQFPENSAARTAFATVAAAARQFEACRITSTVAVHSARTAGKAAARKALLQCLTRGKNTARVLAKEIPQLAACTALPAATKDGLILAVARRLLADITPHRERFAACGFTVEHLSERIETFVRASRELSAHHTEQTAARRGIADALMRAMDAVETLDVVVPNHLAADTIALARWKRDRQVYFNRWSAKRAPRTSSRSVRL